MQRKSIGSSELGAENKKEIYAFLSGTIYNELIDYGVDDEYILSFSLYLHWVAVKEYISLSRKSNIAGTKSILRSVQYSQHVKKNEGQMLTGVIDAFFHSNSESLLSIYNDVYPVSKSLTWLLDWQKLCRSCYKTNNAKLRTCHTLLQAVNDSLNKPYNRTDVSLGILLKIHGIHENNTISTKKD